jgi:hypothetical protein
VWYLAYMFNCSLPLLLRCRLRIRRRTCPALSSHGLKVGTRDVDVVGLFDGGGIGDVYLIKRRVFDFFLKSFA